MPADIPVNLNTLIPARRRILQAFRSAASLFLLPSWGLLWSGRVQANGRHTAFDTTDWSKVMNRLGAEPALVSASIVIDAPDIAENGAYVPVSITSELLNTRSISIIVEHNPTPLVTTMRFAPLVEGFVITQIKMSESSRIRAVILADGKYYTAVREVVVINGGCG